MINKLICRVTLVSIFFVPLNNYAGVNHRNGNFYISYTDAINGDLEITRTYNSISTYKGIFGFGWNSFIESYIIIGPAGTPVLYSHGGGSIGYFKPVSPNQIYKDQLANSIITMERALIKKWITDKDVVDKNEQIKIEAVIKTKLDRENTRQQEWQRLLSDGAVDPINVGVGDEFEYSCSCYFKKHDLVKTSDGFTYTAGSSVQSFDHNGLLQSVITEPGIETSIERGKEKPTQDMITSISSGDNEFIFSYDENGKVESITDNDSDEEAIFIYENGDLVRSVDTDRNEYTYEYDDAHNMTRIGYSDESEMLLKYEPKTNFVSEIVSVSGEITEYKYGVLEGDPSLNYFTETLNTALGSGNNIVKRERREFRNTRTWNGGRILSEGAFESDGLRREYYYDANEVLTRLKVSSLYTDMVETTDFKFDKNARVIRVSSGGWKRAYKYLDDSSPRVTEVSTQVGVENSKYDYMYDGLSRISSAIRYGNRVDISYDTSSKGYIYSLNSANDDIRFVRNDDGLVVKILHSDSNGSRELILEYIDGRPKLRVSSPRDTFLFSSVLSGIMNTLSHAQSDAQINKLIN